MIKLQPQAHFATPIPLITLSRSMLTLLLGFVFSAPQHTVLFYSRGFQPGSYHGRGHIGVKGEGGAEAFVGAGPLQLLHLGFRPDKRETHVPRHLQQLSVLLTPLPLLKTCLSSLGEPFHRALVRLHVRPRPLVVRHLCALHPPTDILWMQLILVMNAWSESELALLLFELDFLGRPVVLPQNNKARTNLLALGLAGKLVQRAAASAGITSASPSRNRGSELRLLGVEIGTEGALAATFGLQAEFVGLELPFLLLAVRQ